MRINRILDIRTVLAEAHRAAARCWRGACGLCHECERSRLAARYATAALLWLAIAATPGHADPRSELEQARHDLAISEQVLARVTERIQVTRSDAATAPEQRQRLDEYLARVRELVAVNRERVRNLTQAVDALPAGTTSAGPQVGTTPMVATDAEEIAALEKKLGGSLAEFDQLLLEEARRAQVRAPDGRSGSAGRSGATVAERTSKGSGTSSSAPGGTAPGNGKAAPQKPATEAGSAGGRIGGGDPGTAGSTVVTPPDVGDGSDDDVVARQIRKVAESEPDPALREKLWEEYRKYKRGT